jgi:hypothetical protein
MISALEVSGAGDGKMFKRDKMGRVRVSRSQRETLLSEFERGGTNGAQFADYVGIKIDIRHLDSKATAALSVWVGIGHQSRALRRKRTAPSDGWKRWSMPKIFIGSDRICQGCGGRAGGGEFRAPGAPHGRHSRRRPQWCRTGRLCSRACKLVMGSAPIFRVPEYSELSIRIRIRS